jgi:hypothetical protein
MEATTVPSRSRNTLPGGFILVLIGAAALTSEVWPDAERFVPLVVGLGLFGIFMLNRSYRALVGACVLSGLGIGLLVAALFPRGGGDADGPGAVLGLGAGFIAIWLVSALMGLKEHHFWPLIPGGILLAVGMGLVLDLFTSDVSRWFVPAAVAVIGLIVMIVGDLGMSRMQTSDSA